jgi:hypothetical protein
MISAMCGRELLNLTTCMSLRDSASLAIRAQFFASSGVFPNAMMSLTYILLIIERMWSL